MSDVDLPDDEIDIKLRDTEEIGARLIILASLLRRVYLEEAEDRDEATRELYDLRHWLLEADVPRLATAGERRLIDAPLGSLTAEATADVALESESLVALGWAVGLADNVPPCDQFALPSDLVAVIPQPWDPTASFADGLNPRSDAAIEVERERAELWFWRAEIEADRLVARGKDREEIEFAIRETAHDADAAGLIETNESRDLLLDGKPFRDLPAESREAVALIAERRLHALNWLCGFGDDWNHVPLDV